MNLLRFESITGHQAEVKHSRGSWGAMCSCNCGKHGVTIYASVAQSEKEALKSLIKIVLDEHRLIVLDRAGWKCELCAAVDGLEVHHKKMRSHGNDHRVTNLISLCKRCHDEAHGVRRADRGL